CCGVAASAGSASPTMGIQQAPSGISFLLDIVLLSVRREPDSLDHALARHPRSLARLLDGCGRRRLEHAKHELVSGQVQRASKNRARTHAALIGGSADRDAKLRLRHAGPEALGRVEHGREPPQWLSQRCPKPIPRPWQRGRRARDSDEAKMGSPRVEFRILGPLAVHVDGTPVPAGGPKQRALLALLLLSANRVVSRERLIGEVFPEQSVSSADHALRNHVSRLRKVLSPSATGEARLVARPPGYLLRVEPGELDLENFERLAVEGRQAESLDFYRRTRRLLDEELGLAPTAELQQLERAILMQDPALRVAVEVRGRPAARATQLVCPFKGLASFEAADAPFFFGRERLVDELVPRLQEAPLLAISGPSGIGKSSLLRAGLLPSLPGHAAVVRPGERPTAELTRALGCELADALA